VITNLIVIVTIVLACIYFLIWIIRQDFREQVERPKYQFQDRLEQYERQCSNVEDSSVECVEAIEDRNP